MDFLYIFLDVFALLVVFFLWWMAVSNYAKLPSKIPTHFDPTDEPDAYGSRKFIFFYPVLGTVFAVVFWYLLRNPEDFSYPVEITPENMGRQFNFALVAMRLLLIFCLVIFLNLLDYSVRKSLDASAKPRITFLSMMLSLFALVGGIIVAAKYLN